METKLAKKLTDKQLNKWKEQKENIWRVMEIET